MRDVSLRELSDRATPGLWHAVIGQDGKGNDRPEDRWILGGGSNLGETGFGSLDMKAQDADFIVRLVNDYRAGRLHDDAALAKEREEGRRAGLEEAGTKADEQLAYWRKRMAAEKTRDDGISEDGETYTPIGDDAAWQGGYCNGRLSEADWWRSTIRALADHPPARDTLDTEGTR
jgi:hypothetical protein